MASQPPQNPSLRQRKARRGSYGSDESPTASTRHTGSEDEVVWGKVPDGTVFRVPKTHDVLTSLFHPLHPKSHLDLVTLASLGLQLVLFCLLPKRVSQVLFFLYFAFWRTAYDGGLGWILTQQSKRRWIVREVRKRGWMDKAREPRVRTWIKKQLQGKMGSDYDFDAMPLEYNTWLLFRQFVDIILLNDFVAYCMFAFSYFRNPNGLSVTMHVLRWIGGLALIAFNWWVKTEAHHVVKDYGWYWGDVFFARGNLVFDGVFEMAPHPMYSVGYAGYYGLSMIIGSYVVLFVSLAAHAAQFGFLTYFENPHIERMYGQKKLLALRTPLSRSRSEANVPSLEQDGSGSDTPAITEGETTQSEDELQDPPRSLASAVQNEKFGTTPHSEPNGLTTQHDLFNRYFHKDAVVIFNLDLLRASDFALVLLLGYVFMLIVAHSLSHDVSILFFFVQALLWRSFHSFGLGLLLRAQSERKWIVRHFIKHYHFPGEEGTKRAMEEAFENWKVIYNLSLCMTYASFGALALNTYHIPVNWTVGGELLRHTLGVGLLGLHVWSANESFKALGLFGWFFGDFFIDDYPSQLEYTGIYRYLNNPEKSMSGAAVWGLSLISGSKLVLSLAVFSHLAHWWFLSCVETPHMRRIYGDAMRKEAGFTRTIKTVARKNARLLESRAGKHAPELRKVAEEVRERLERAFEETADAFEDFLDKSQPRIAEVMQEARTLFQQSRERLILTRLASDLSAYDKSKYALSPVPPANDGIHRWHLGEPIRVAWTAPDNHARRDWIGLYRIGANRSRLVTQVASLGHWRPIVDEEWDGDVALHNETPLSVTEEKGEVIFCGRTLPWQVGMFELRYHHDGLYNVMAVSPPIQIFVDTPSTFDYSTVHDHLARIVVLGLDNEPDLVPPCTLPLERRQSDLTMSPEDFRFYEEDQAARIATGIRLAFGVEYATDVIVADANLSTLTKRILASRELLAPFSKAL